METAYTLQISHHGNGLHTTDQSPWKQLTHNVVLHQHSHDPQDEGREEVQEDPVPGAAEPAAHTHTHTHARTHTHRHARTHSHTCTHTFI